MPIEHINKTDTLNEGREKLNAAIDGANAADITSQEADTKATQALANSESTQTQLDMIVIDGDSSVEAAQARVDEKGVTHPTLKARIDDGLNSVNQQLAQTNDEIDSLEKSKASKDELRLKMDRGESITVEQIDKNKGKLDQTYMSEEFLQQMTGDTPINAVPADDSLTEEKYVDESVTSFKSTVNGGVGIATHGLNAPLPNFNTSEKCLEFEGTFYVTYKRERTVLDEPVTVSFAEQSNIQYLLFNTKTKSFRFLSASNEWNIGEDNLLMGFVVFDSLSTYKIHNIKMNFNFTIDGEDPSVVSTSNIADEAVTIDKRTVNGEFGTIMPGSNSPVPDVDLDGKKILIYGTSFLYYRNIRVSFYETVEVPFWGDPLSNQALIYNTKTNEFSCHTANTVGTWITDDHITLMHMVFTDNTQSELKSAYATFEFTVNGEPYPNINASNGTHSVLNDEFIVDSLNSSEFFGETLELEARDMMSTGYQFIYDRYDELANEYPNITKSIAGVDAFGNNINRYDVKPQGMVDVDGNKVEPNLPKVFWNVAVHGNERISAWVAYNALKVLMEHKETNLEIQNFLNNHHIIILPVANPSGFDRRRRHNDNGVDLNRNQPDGWESTDTSGEYPLSEPESVVINNIINEENMKLVIDFHNFASTPQEQHFLWIPSASNHLRNVAHSFILTMSSEFKKDYPTLPDEVFGYTSAGNSSGTIGAAASSQNIYGGTFEVCERFFLINDERGSSEVVSAGAKAFINWNLVMSKNVKSVDNWLD